MKPNENYQKILDQHEYLKNNSILIGYRGSIAHGMYIPNTDPHSVDDKDVMAIVIPNIDCYFGLNSFGSRGTKEVFQNEWDIVTYELLKFVSLLKQSNPNVMCMLWMDDEYYLHVNEAGTRLIENRHLFSSKQAYYAFAGYAKGQFQRMTRFSFKGYMGEKRKKLVEQFGYDTKNAAHLIRLLRMGIEFLRDQKIYVKRPDAEYLLNIKRGGMSLEEVKAEADMLFKEIDKAMENCTLPEKCDITKINDLCISILQDHFGKIP